MILEDKLHFERVKTLPTCITLRRWYYDVAYKQKKGPFFSQVYFLNGSHMSWVFDIQIVHPRFPKSTKERKK